MNELSTEIDNHVAICQRAQDYIHSDECILTYGYSKLVESFLKAAATKRRFQLIVAEAEPSLEGHKLAEVLSKVLIPLRTSSVPFYSLTFCRLLN